MKSNLNSFIKANEIEKRTNNLTKSKKKVQRFIVVLNGVIKYTARKEKKANLVKMHLLLSGAKAFEVEIKTVNYLLPSKN